MSANHAQHLNMAELAGPAGPASPQTPAESPAAPLESKQFVLTRKDDPEVVIPATLERKFKNGEEASYHFHWYFNEVEPVEGRRDREDLVKGDEVTITTGNGFVVAATFVSRHKNHGKVTLHTVWPNDQVEPAPERTKGSRKRAKTRPKSDPKVPKVPTVFSATEPTPIAVLFVSERDLSRKPTAAEVATLLRKLGGFVAPAKATTTVVLLSNTLSDLYKKLYETGAPVHEFVPTCYTAMGSEFDPDSLDLEKIKDRVAHLAHGARELLRGALQPRSRTGKLSIAAAAYRGAGAG
jgi:hypothetical protein